MRRRTFLACAALSASAAGCIGGDSEDSTPDGYAPDSVEEPEPIDVDTDSFERIEVEGQQVPLAPVEVAYNWYGRRKARFADARGEGQYERARITGAAWSPASGNRANDPTEEWPTGDHIVCYCGCPHHLSSIRAAALIASGYEEVYVIDEGFFEWADRGYPISGSEVKNSYVVRGRSDAAYAGEAVYARHEPTDQREAAFVGDDGRYELTLHFAAMTEQSEIVLEAPEYTLEAPLAELTEGVVTGP